MQITLGIIALCESIFVMGDLEKIEKFSSAMLNAAELEDLLWSIAQSIGEILKFEDCVIYLKIDDKLVQKAAFGIKNPKGRSLLNEIEIPVGKGIVGSVAKAGIAEIVSDTRLDDRYIHDEFSGLSELAVPILYENKTIAVIDTESSLVNRYSEKDMALLRIIANIASPRITSAKYCSKLQQTQKQLEETNTELAHSITQLKSNQESLIHSEKMASIGLLAAGVAHEINNPLGFSISNLSIMKEYLTTIKLLDKALSTTPSLPNNIQKIIQTADYQDLLEDIDNVTMETESGLLRIKDIVSDICNYARNRDKDKDTSIVDINDSIRASLNLLRGQISDTNVIQVKLGSIPSITGNKGKLLQVFMNIIRNSLQAIPATGTITISTFIDESSNQITINIQDNGCGISPQNIKSIFTPFFTTKSVGKGTGLGLFICYRIITEEYNGKIQVVSDDTGCTFKVSLPIAAVATDCKTAKIRSN